MKRLLKTYFAYSLKMANEIRKTNGTNSDCKWVWGVGLIRIRIIEGIFLPFALVVFFLTANRYENSCGLLQTISLFAYSAGTTIKL